LRSGLNLNPADIGHVIKAVSGHITWRVRDVTGWRHLLLTYRVSAVYTEFISFPAGDVFNNLAATSCRLCYCTLCYDLPGLSRATV